MAEAGETAQPTAPSGARPGLRVKARSVVAAPVVRLRAFLVGPLAERSDEQSQRVALLAAEVDHLLWLQTNHLEHLLGELGRQAWLNWNHANHEFRVLREAVGASDVTPVMNEREEMLLELLVQVQALAASLGTTESHISTALAELSTRLEALEAQVARLTQR